MSERRASGAFTDQSFQRPYKRKNQSFYLKDIHKTKIAVSLRRTGVAHSRLFSIEAKNSTSKQTLRAYYRILKLASTIANLAASEEIQSVHLAKALHASQSSQVDDGLADYSVPIKWGKLK